MKYLSHIFFLTLVAVPDSSLMTPNYRGGNSSIASGSQTQVQCILNGILIKYILDTDLKSRSCNMFIIGDICNLICLFFWQSHN